MIVSRFESLLEKAHQRYLAGDLIGADEAFRTWIEARRAEYERSKIDVNEGRGTFELLERVRKTLEHAELAYQHFHDLVEIWEEENAKLTQIETRH